VDRVIFYLLIVVAGFNLGRAAGYALAFLTFGFDPDQVVPAVLAGLLGIVAALLTYFFYVVVIREKYL
jgi:hypothetical protein